MANKAEPAETDTANGQSNSSGQAPKASRALVLCSDGTGNKGGYGADSNVFKTYKAVDIHDPRRPQITFYDNGVGTASNKYLRAITGAFGLGFQQNVRDLYEFLARNYQAGDKIFLFGFSRGAATVRAFAGMIGVCGLLDAKGHAWRDEEGFINEERFQDLIDQAMKAYQVHRDQPEVAETFKQTYAHALSSDGGADGKLAIEFLGVWDTVSALGWPQDWSRLVDWLFKGLEYVSNKVFPHQFYDYQAGPFVNRVCHALAIDDQRQTFHPKVWTETASKRPVEIEQVWFAGVHSNVGGGYPRAGMSIVALDWMMERAETHSNLLFKKRPRADAKADANVFGKLYDSRAGVAVYYRYSPRNIEALCAGRLEGSVKIHESVFRRIEQKTAGYAPGQLPYEFESVATDTAQPPVKGQAAATEQGWADLRAGIERCVTARKNLYKAFAEASFLFLAASFVLWIWGPSKEELAAIRDSGSGLAHYIAGALEYATPTFFDGIIHYLTRVYYGLAGLLFIAVLVLFYLARNHFRKKSHEACEAARRSLLRQMHLERRGKNDEETAAET